MTENAPQPQQMPEPMLEYWTWVNRYLRDMTGKEAAFLAPLEAFLREVGKFANLELPTIDPYSRTILPTEPDASGRTFSKFWGSEEPHRESS